MIETEDLEKIKSLAEEVRQASNALSQQLYAQEEGASPSEDGVSETPDEGEGEEEGDVVEGEFREA